MFSIETVIIYLTMVIVTINGQNTVLPIWTTLNVTCSPADTKNPANNSVDTDSMTAPTTCGATAYPLGVSTITDCRFDLMADYYIVSITIANKPIIMLASGNITTTLNSGLNQPNKGIGMKVGLQSDNGQINHCGTVKPSNYSVPFSTITSTAVTATYYCWATARYIIMGGVYGVNAAVCAFRIMLRDPQTTTTTFTTTKAVKANIIVTNDSRYVRFDWSIMIAMLLAAVKVTMDNGRHY